MSSDSYLLHAGEKKTSTGITKKQVLYALFATVAIAGTTMLLRSSNGVESTQAQTNLNA
jgi:hypothetical protein